MLATITMTLLSMDDPIDGTAVCELEWPELLASVDMITPTTIVRRDTTSGKPSVSIPLKTATAALVIGSAALTVSTKDAELP